MSEIGAADFPSGRWRARWIWCEAPQFQPGDNFMMLPTPPRRGSHGCFRRSFRLDRVPERVPARISADSRYLLWANGVEIARGPVRCNPRRLHYDLLDLAPFLRPGDNCLAVLVRFYGRATPWWAPANRGTLQLGGGSLVFEARLDRDDWILSDGEWRARSPEAWEEIPGSGTGGMPPECFDAGKLPAGWREVGFDDSDWTPAAPLAANCLGFSGHHQPPSQPFGAMRPRPIPMLEGRPREARLVRVATGSRAEDRAHPAEQVLADGETASAIAGSQSEAEVIEIDAVSDQVSVLTFDFGEVVSGTLVLDVDAPPGARFDLAGAEFATEEGRLDPEDEKCGLRYLARGEGDRFESFDRMGLRYAGLSIRAKGRVRLRPLSVKERLYPRPEGPFFECSDPVLEKIWRIGRRSVDINSHDAYLDCPTREQRAWVGDFVVHQMVDLTSNPDWGLARWNVELAASPRPDGMLPMAAGGDVEHLDAAFIPDWALHWIRALHNLYRYTGDRELVGRLLPVAEGVLRWFLPFRDENGLLCDVTGWVIIDWSSVSVAGKSSVLNGLWGRGLLDFAEMAEWLGDAGRASWARETHAQLSGAFEAFWDPERRLYVDHIDGGERGRPASQHGQAAPLVADLAPRERVERLVDLLIDRERRVHATWSRARGDSRFPAEGERGVGGAYLVLGPPPPWWDVERQLVAAQPFFRYVVHDALAQAGREDLIASQCLDWQELFARSETSWSETWYGGTISHGWCSTPTRDLLTRTLGLSPAEPGFGVARVAPRLGSLSWARGAVPTPRGLLRVEANRERVEVDSPVPFELDLGAVGSRRHPAGRHDIPVG
jgi:hypothetical protein